MKCINCKFCNPFLTGNTPLCDCECAKRRILHVYMRNAYFLMKCFLVTDSKINDCMEFVIEIPVSRVNHLKNCHVIRYCVVEDLNPVHKSLCM